MDYPANIFTVRDSAPENGDGQSFHSGDGRAQLLIYGAYNTEGDTPKSYLEKHADEGVSYRHTTARTYVDHQAARLRSSFSTSAVRISMKVRTISSTALP